MGLEEHLRQAEADLGLARGAIDRAVAAVSGSGNKHGEVYVEPVLRFLANQTTVAANCLAAIRRASA